jgi:ribosomal protein S6--L-glutamate ligase
MAVVRQFEAMGTFCLNSAASIGTSRDKLAAHQVLALTAHFAIFLSS